MVKGYQFKCDYGDGCGMKEYKSHEHLGADYVLATNYAALEAERDEWKRRCENIVTALGAKGFSAEFLARIAEGRDNG